MFDFSTWYGLKNSPAKRGGRDVAEAFYSITPASIFIGVF